MDDTLDDNRISLETVQDQMALDDFNSQAWLDFNPVAASTWEGIDFLKCVEYPFESTVRLP